MMIDIHSHILPGIDDGAGDAEAALGMARIALKDGISKMIATPHFIPGEIENTAEAVHNKCLEFKRLLAAEGIGLEIFPGTEVFITPDTPELIEGGGVCTLAGSRYVLLELPMMSVPGYTGEVLYRLQLNGYIPIIAHPEQIGRASWGERVLI